MWFALRAPPCRCKQQPMEDEAKAFVSVPLRMQCIIYQLASEEGAKWTHSF